MVTLITPDKVNELWNNVEPYIDAAIHEYSLLTIEDLKRGCESGEYGLWVHLEGAAVTILDHFPKGRVLQLAAIGGNKNSVDLIEEVIETFAKEIGCIEVIAVGRKGWIKRRPDYEFAGVLYRKKVN
jgi:hypothetical protein